MELCIFARLHAVPGNESALEQAIKDVLAPTRKEEGCLAVNAFRSIRDPHLFYIHSRWKSEAAFEVHIGLPHTVRFVDLVEPLLDHAFEVTRATIME